MIELSILSICTIFALVYVILKNSGDFSKERDKWTEERQILLNRIENPKYMPPITAGEKQANLDEIRRLREETEAFGLVGKIID